jgi:hypothetical protein
MASQLGIVTIASKQQISSDGKMLLQKAGG